MNHYFYVDAKRQQKGPLPADRLAEAGVTGETLVWRQGMQNWQPASSIAELKDLLAKPHTEMHGYPQGFRHGNENHTEGDYRQKTENYPQENGTQAEQYGTPKEDCVKKTFEELERHEAKPDFRPCPPTYMVWSILSTICCCLPFGIVAIVKSRQVNKNYEMKRYDQALIASADAKKWCIVALVLGILSCVILSGLNIILTFFNWVLSFVMGFSMVGLDILDSLL